MKKLLAIGLVSFSLSMSLAEARFFVGIEGGWGKGDNTLDNGLVKYKYFTNSKAMHGWLILVNGGGEWMFTDNLGVRTFLSLGYGQNYLQNERFFHDLELGVNADLIYDIIKGSSLSFGVFGGVGVGYNVTAGKLGLKVLSTGANIPVYGRAGLTLGIGENSRVDITAYLPIASFNAFGFKGGLNNLLADTNLQNEVINSRIAGAYNPIRFTLAYRYIF